MNLGKMLAEKSVRVEKIKPGCFVVQRVAMETGETVCLHTMAKRSEATVAAEEMRRFAEGVIHDAFSLVLLKVADQDIKQRLKKIFDGDGDPGPDAI